MMATLIFASMFVGLLMLSVALQAIFLRWGLAWAKIAQVSMRKALALTLIFIVANIVITLCFLSFTPTSPSQTITADIAEIALQVAVPCMVIARTFGAKHRRAFQAWLPTFIPIVAILAVSLLVIRPLVYEAFVAPTNSMAPTIIGNHSVGACPRCGAAAFGYLPASEREIPPDGLVMMCTKELRSCKVKIISDEAGRPDHFLVAKFIAPRRWDVIVFRLPSDPAIYYVKRLVGLPGEELLLRDGAVWINGTKLEPPESIRGIEYLTSIEWGGVSRSAAGSSPVRLGDDEYFVLGDFSAQAADSRFWEAGAPGHPPYAVPESHIVGVVTHIYWPITRWRILR